MNFLDKMVIPQSLENLILLKYILTLALIIFLPFVGLLLISSFVSLFFNLVGRKYLKEHYIKFSKEIIDIVAASKSILLVLGVIPAISLILAYSQLLHASKIYIEGSLMFALMLLITAVFLIMNYKYTFNLDQILKFARGQKVEASGPPVNTEEEEKIKHFLEENLKRNKKSGIWGVSLLFVSTFIILSSIQMSYDPSKWSEKISIFTIIFSLKGIIKYIYFLLASLALASGATLFYYFRFKGKDPSDSSYFVFVKKISVWTGIISVAALPLFVLINLLMTPQSAVSISLFTLTAVILIILFAAIHLYYILVKKWSNTYSAYLFYILILFFAISVIIDQTSFSYSTKKQEMVLAANYDLIVARAKEKAGKGPAISGKDIFDGRCSACHRFDTKLVGPAYKDVLPKYEGHMDQLIAFISNPVKKNPAFPPMPNQGLKPKEVQAIADYIMKTYKQK